QPEGGFRPVTPDDPMYRGAIHHIAAVRLDVRSRRAKFKLAQNRPPHVRATIAEALRKRGRPNDERAADALVWTIEQEAKRLGSAPTAFTKGPRRPSSSFSSASRKLRL